VAPRWEDVAKSYWIIPNGVLDRGGDGLRRADEFLQDTKQYVSEALEAGEEAIRPAAASREA
jgi:hypothetical protein